MFKISRLTSIKSSLALSKFNLKISQRQITISILATHNMVNLQVVISILEGQSINHKMMRVGVEVVKDKDSTLVSNRISKILTTMKPMGTKRCSLLK